MLEFAQEICSLQAERYKNCYIGRISYTRLQHTKLAISGKLNLTVLKQTKTRETIRICQNSEQGKCLAYMEVLIFYASKNTGKISASKQVGALPPGLHKWRSFTAQQIRDYSSLVRDSNPLHLGANPVVQGFLLFETLYKDKQEPEKLVMHFHKSIFANTEIYLQESKKHDGKTNLSSTNDDLESTGNDQDGFMCSAFSSSGVHFFSAAVYPSYGNRSDSCC